MALVFKRIIDTYNYIDHDISDPRTRHHYIILNPIIVALFLFIFHQFVYKWGPKLMEKREPFQLKKIMIVYNVIQIYLSLYMFFKSLFLVWLSGYYDIKCQPIIYEDTPTEREIGVCILLFYSVKIMDLLDTIFFVLRKKYNQVTFLHVYHHIGMVFAGFMGMKYIPAAHGTMLGTINSLVHAVMYFYYLLSCVSDHYKKSIWWKKYITQMQIIQFLLLFIHFGHVLFRPDCGYPKWVSLVFVPQNLFMLIMFSDFYYKSYLRKKKVT